MSDETDLWARARELGQGRFSIVKVGLVIVPDKIVGYVRCDEGGDPSGIILQVTVRSGHRNPYQILMPKTQLSGQTELSRDEFIGQFKDHWEYALMDHNGTPENASPVVTVRLFDRSMFLASRQSLLSLPLLTHERKRWQSREQWFEYHASCRNHEFAAPAADVDLEVSPEFVYVIRPRRLTSR